MTDRPWTPPEQRTVASRHLHLRPMPHAGTTRMIQNGMAGTEPLPVQDLPNGYQTVWGVPKAFQSALKKNGWVISVVVVTGPDGQPQMSITIPPVTLTRSNG